MDSPVVSTTRAPSSQANSVDARSGALRRACWALRHQVGKVFDRRPICYRVWCSHRRARRAKKRGPLQAVPVIARDRRQARIGLPLPVEALASDRDGMAPAPILANQHGAGLDMAARWHARCPRPSRNVRLSKRWSQQRTKRAVPPLPAVIEPKPEARRRRTHRPSSKSSPTTPPPSKSAQPTPSSALPSRGRSKTSTSASRHTSTALKRTSADRHHPSRNRHRLLCHHRPIRLQHHEYPNRGRQTRSLNFPIENINLDHVIPHRNNIDATSTSPKRPALAF